MFVLNTNITNIFSALRRPERSQKLSVWLSAQHEEDLFLSVVTIGEIARGIVQQEEKNAPFAKDLKIWLNKTETLLKDRILPFTSQDAHGWGVLSAQIGHTGADLMIAATALSHDATIVTRNLSDFEPTGVKLLNPF